MASAFGLALGSPLPAFRALMLVALISVAASGSEGAVTVWRDEVAHGGGLNGCGCHFNRKTGECHCHRPFACGCECQPAYCPAGGGKGRAK
jgi:hypothetical protein